jgi:hypothetical protein
MVAGLTLASLVIAVWSFCEETLPVTGALVDFVAVDLEDLPELLPSSDFFVMAMVCVPLKGEIELLNALLVCTPHAKLLLAINIFSNCFEMCSL